MVSHGIPDVPSASKVFCSWMMPVLDFLAIDSLAIAVLVGMLLKTAMTNLSLYVSFVTFISFLDAHARTLQNQTKSTSKS